MDSVDDDDEPPPLDLRMRWTKFMIIDRERESSYILMGNKGIVYGDKKAEGQDARCGKSLWPVENCG